MWLPTGDYLGEEGGPTSKNPRSWDPEKKTGSCKGVFPTLGNTTTRSGRLPSKDKDVKVQTEKTTQGKLSRREWVSDVVSKTKTVVVIVRGREPTFSRDWNGLDRYWVTVVRHT